MKVKSGFNEGGIVFKSSIARQKEAIANGEMGERNYCNKANALTTRSASDSRVREKEKSKQSEKELGVGQRAEWVALSDNRL